MSKVALAMGSKRPIRSSKRFLRVLTTGLAFSLLTLFTNPVATSAASTFSAADFKTIGLQGQTDPKTPYTILPTSAGGYLDFPLTPTTNWHAGAAWNQKRINLAQDFEINAQVNLGSSEGADGMAFVLQPNSTSTVSSGGGLGYQGITPAFAVEFDTWSNSELGDSGTNGAGTNDYMSFTKNGETNHSAAINTGLPAQVSVGNLEDGVWRDFKFTYNSTTNTAKAYLSASEILSANVDLDGSYFSNTSGIVYWGFTAATGGANNLQKVRFADNSVFVATPRVNTAPTISSVSNQTMNPSATNVVNLSLADDSTTQSQWSVAAVSSNPAFTVSTSVTSSTAGTVSVTSGAAAGTSTITVTVTDADGSTAITSYTVTSGTSPSIPFSITAHQYGTSADLSWTAPTSLGGATNYLIQYSADGSTWTSATDTVSSLTTETVTGLPNSQIKRFRVKAVNALGESSWSNARTISFPKGTAGYIANTETVIADSGITPELAGYNSATITVNINAGNSGLLTLTTINGLTIPSAFTDVTQVNALSFTGSLNDVNTAIATLRFVKAANGTSVIDFQAADSSALVNKDNNHVYEVVASTASWTDAKNAALLKTVPKLGGGTCPGYLATITSPEENDFVYGKVREASWLGGSDATTEGSWYWVTDPDISSTKFWQGTGSSSGGAATNSMYTNWNGAGEPNNSGSNEDAIQMLSSGLWNDLPDTGSTLTKYIVEYGSTSCTPEAAVSTAAVTYTAQVADVPGAPTSVSGTAGQRSVSLTWAAPSSDGGSSITDYVVEYKVASGSTWTVFADGTSTATSSTVTGLTEGVAYNFRVKAVNIISASGGNHSTASSNVTPTAAVPGLATSLSVVIADGSLDADWLAPSDNGGSAITDYVVEYQPLGGSWATFSDGVSTATAAIITGLTPGTQYYVRVSAKNSIGTGAAVTSAQPAIAMVAPSDVTGLTSEAGSSQVTASWTATSALGGGTLLDYYVYLSTDNKSTWVRYADGVSTATTTTMTGLTNGLSYWVKVVVKNSGSLYSAGVISATAVTPTAPPVPVPANSSTPTPTATPSPSSSPTSSPRPSSSARPSVAPLASPTPSPTPSPSAQAVPTAVLQPVLEPQQNVAYENVSEIPQVIVNTLQSPIAFTSGNSADPILPELSPSQATVVVNGETIPVEIIKNTADNGYVIKGEGFQVSFSVVDKQGNTLKLDNSGNIILNADRTASFTGYGFAPGSIIKVWLFSDPTSLQEVVADENGEFVGTATVPNGLPFGEHTIQLNGVSQEGLIRSVALGVVIQDLSTDEPKSSNNNSIVWWGFITLVAVVAFVLLMIGLRRKTRN